MAKVRVCSYRNCYALVEGEYRCKKHPLPKRVYKKHRFTNKQRGYGAAHKRWRDAILRRDPVCKECHKRPSIDAHHIDGNTKNRSLENGLGLCRRCHNGITHGKLKSVKPKQSKPDVLWFV